MKLKGTSITRDEVSKFVVFLERYDGNSEIGVTKFIDTASTKTITMKQINRLSRQLAIREHSNTKMSAMTRSLLV